MIATAQDEGEILQDISSPHVTDCPKILDAGTEVLDDYDVLKFIRDKRAQIKAEKEQSKEEGRPTTHRPANLMKSLQKVLPHLLVALASPY